MCKLPQICIGQQQLALPILNAKAQGHKAVLCASALNSNFHLTYRFFAQKAGVVPVSAYSPTSGSQSPQFHSGFDSTFASAPGLPSVTTGI